MRDIALIVASYVGGFILGGIFSVWIYYRGRANASPLPTLPKRENQAKPVGFKVPEIKP